MSIPFNSQRGLIIVGAELEGPTGIAVVRLALDTGASGTVINIGILVSIGYDPSLAPTRVQMTTGSGVEFAPKLTFSRIQALHQHRIDMPVLGHTLPPSATVDGLLGLDFFRGMELNINFRTGLLTLS